MIEPETTDDDVPAPERWHVYQMDAVTKPRGWAVGPAPDRWIGECMTKDDANKVARFHNASVGQ